MKWRAAPEIADQAPQREVRRAGMDLLARREHSAQELRRKLLARGFHESEVEAALAGLERDGLLSDRRFAESFVASRARRGPGPVRIRAELSQRGVDDALAGEALAGARVDWDDLAREVRRKRFTAPPRSFPERARQARFLEYRGFTAEQTRAALGDDDYPGGEQTEID